MAVIRDQASVVYADGPSSNPSEPDKAAIRSLFATVEDEVAAASAGTVRAETWAALSAINGTRNGQPGQVPDQAGTHTDPVTSTTVPNQGEYRWVSSSSAWRWVAEIPEVEITRATDDTVKDAVDDVELVTPEALASAYKPANEATALKMLDGVLADGRYFVVHAGSNDAALMTYDLQDQVYDLPARSLTELSDAAAMEFNYSLAFGETVYPLVFNSDYEIILGVDVASGELVGSLPGTGGGGTGTAGDSMGYVSGTTLRAIGGPGGDRVLDNSGARTWLAAQTEGPAVRAVYQDGSYKQLVRVSFGSGNLYHDGEVTVWIALGQSNAEGQASSAGVTAIVTNARYGSKLLMPNPNIWVGHATTAGTSEVLDPDAVTALIPLVDSIAPSGTHGTVSISGAVRAEMAAALAETGWIPEMVAWTGAEGGQSIYNLLPDPPPGYHSFANEALLLEKVVALLPGKKVVVRWIDMAQGEANSSLSTLAELHDDLREAYQTMAQGETGQTDPVRMMSWQMSSFMTNSASALTILTYAVANEAAFGNFWCAGPTYIFPFTSTDYLHQTSLGHLMRGEVMRVAAKSVEKTGYWRPLRMVSASVTATNTITVTLSEAAVVDEEWLTAAVANAGISVDSRTVSAVNVSGTTLTITTVEAAAGATTVRAAMNLQSDPRTEANIPRSNIRSVASYGKFSADCGIYAGVNIYKPLCHQALTIS